MAGLYHDWGQDLQLNSSGGLLIARSGELTKQRLVRRIFTNQGDMMESSDYGGNVRSTIGTPTNVDRIKATILEQCKLEPGVKASPAPTVTVVALDALSVLVNVKFVDANSGETQTVSVTKATGG